MPVPPELTGVLSALPVWKVNILFKFRTKITPNQMDFMCDINNIYYGIIIAKIFLNNFWEVLNGPETD